MDGATGRLWHTLPDQRITSISLGRPRDGGSGGVLGTGWVTSVQRLRAQGISPQERVRSTDDS